MRLTPVFIFSILLLTACSAVPETDTQELTVVASTQIVGDVVSSISGEQVDVTFLIPSGTDPHAYEPTPQDAVRLTEADLIFVNGFGLEQTLQHLLVDQQAKVVNTSEGISPLTLVEEGESGSDPHVWMNPVNVEIWADNIAQALTEADPANAQIYRENSEAYKSEIELLDSWVADQVSQIPEENRKLVTDHESFGYFADHYGFEIVGAIIPSYSTLSEPSAGELAQLEAAINQFGVKAIFVGVSLNPTLADRIAQDTGVQLVSIYTESLSDKDGSAHTYLEMIHFDVESIVAALK